MSCLSRRHLSKRGLQLTSLALIISRVTSTASAVKQMPGEEFSYERLRGVCTVHGGFLQQLQGSVTQTACADACKELSICGGFQWGIGKNAGHCILGRTAFCDKDRNWEYFRAVRKEDYSVTWIVAPTTAKQSSKARQASDAATAIDGNEESCTATNFEPNPWLEVDLGQSTDLAYVNLTLYTGCIDHDYSLLVDDVPCNSSFEAYSSEHCKDKGLVKRTVVIKCNATGTRLRLRKSGTDALRLCEVAILASKRFRKAIKGDICSLNQWGSQEDCMFSLNNKYHCVDGCLPYDVATGLPTSRQGRYAPDDCLPNVGDVEPCQACPPGHKGDSKGLNACQVCPVGTYSDRYASTSCDTCPYGRYSTNAGVTACKECPAGKSSSPDRTDCVECAHGFFGSSCFWQFHSEALLEGLLVAVVLCVLLCVLLVSFQWQNLKIRFITFHRADAKPEKEEKPKPVPLIADPGKVVRILTPRNRSLHYQFHV